MVSNTGVILLKKCVECGRDFFSEGEHAYYKSKNLIIPSRCKQCREKRKSIGNNSLNAITTMNSLIKNTQEVYEEIINNWSVEAKKEDRAYFYNIQEVNVIAEGRKTFIIGRKGSGKTAIAQHLLEMEQDKYDIFTEKLSFKNFPFNILYSLENQKDYTSPNQYISIWKYLIYSYICKKMINNENIDAGVRNKLTKLYGDSSMKSLNRLIEKWTSKSFGAEVLGIGFNYEREKQPPECTWIDTIDILEQVILEYCDDSKYFIIFDELDEDYKDFTSEAESNNYMSMLTSLFKAVQDIRNTFDRVGKKIYPIIFLRSDIYTRLKDSDKNKWNESIIYLEWDSNRIKRMLAHRLCVAFEVADVDFDTIWYKLFVRKSVKMGNRQAREMETFTYIERSTEMRPRDFIQYVKECVTIAKERAEIPITPLTVKDADDNFSEYLKGETIDEIFAVLPEINEILGLLSTIRKQSFKFDIFELEYNKLVKSGAVPKRDVKQILLILFDTGVIGNQPTMRGQAIFRFSTKSPRFNFNETMMVHRGLYKALQIF
jgi:Cdc6-like AAA superfamily ATPase